MSKLTIEDNISQSTLDFLDHFEFTRESSVADFQKKFLLLLSKLDTWYSLIDEISALILINNAILPKSVIIFDKSKREYSIERETTELFKESNIINPRSITASLRAFCLDINNLISLESGKKRTSFIREAPRLEMFCQDKLDLKSITLWFLSFQIWIKDEGIENEWKIYIKKSFATKHLETIGSIDELPSNLDSALVVICQCLLRNSTSLIDQELLFDAFEADGETCTNFLSLVDRISYICFPESEKARVRACCKKLWNTLHEKGKADYKESYKIITLDIDHIDTLPHLKDFFRRRFDGKTISGNVKRVEPNWKRPKYEESRERKDEKVNFQPRQRRFEPIAKKTVVKKANQRYDLKDKSIRPTGSWGTEMIWCDTHGSWGNHVCQDYNVEPKLDRDSSTPRTGTVSNGSQSKNAAKNVSFDNNSSQNELRNPFERNQETDKFNQSESHNEHRGSNTRSEESSRGGYSGFGRGFSRGFNRGRGFHSNRGSDRGGFGRGGFSSDYQGRGRGSNG